MARVNVSNILTCPMMIETKDLIRMLLDQALKVFADVRCYAGEAARVKLLKSVALKHQEKLVESAGCLHEAHRLYRTVCKIDTDEKDLTVEDINKYVHVWGR